MMDLDQAIRERRSVRRFRPEPVLRADIEAMLEAACWAPSSTNLQPWRFLVVLKRDLIQQMAQLVRDRFDAAIRQARQRQERLASVLLRFMRGYGSFFADAPAVIVACGVPYAARPDTGGDEAIAKIAQVGGDQVAHIFASTVDKSVSMATQNLLLKAHALGYGAVVIDTPLAAEGAIKALLGIPADDPLRIIMLVALGRPAEKPSPPPRHPLAEVTRFYE